MSTCTACIRYVTQTAGGPSPGPNIRCQKPQGHTGTHYCSMPGGGVAWPPPPVQP